MNLNKANITPANYYAVLICSKIILFVPYLKRIKAVLFRYHFKLGNPQHTIGRAFYFSVEGGPS